MATELPPVPVLISLPSAQRAAAISRIATLEGLDAILRQLDAEIERSRVEMAAAIRAGREKLCTPPQSTLELRAGEKPWAGA